MIDPRLAEERAVKQIKQGISLRAAAKAEGVSEEKVRRYLKENTGASRIGRTWIIEDERPRQYPFYSDGRLASPWLAPEEASRAAKFMLAVQAFLPSGGEDLLAPFIGQSVTDIHGKHYPFETDPNGLFELDAAGELDFPERLTKRLNAKRNAGSFGRSASPITSAPYAVRTICSVLRQSILPVEPTTTLWFCFAPTVIASGLRTSGVIRHRATIRVTSSKLSDAGC